LTHEFKYETINELLDSKYGVKGSPEREKFDRETIDFLLSETNQDLPEKLTRDIAEEFGLI